VIKDDSFPFPSNSPSLVRDLGFDPEQIAYWASLFLFHAICLSEIKGDPLPSPYKLFMPF
jgi:hypothetical protein